MPQVDYPTIEVQTLYPGASPEAMGYTVTAPLEARVRPDVRAAADELDERGRRVVVTLQFSLGISHDVAEQEVQAAINAGGSLLPADLPAPPVYAKVNPADAPVLTLAISSERMPLTEVQNLVNTRLAQKISQVRRRRPGHAQRRPATGGAHPGRHAGARLVRDRDRHGPHGDRAANANSAKGSFDGPRRAYTINANDQLLTADDYGAWSSPPERRAGAAVGRRAASVRERRERPPRRLGWQPR